MSRPIKVGVIGLGWVALNRHLPVIQRNPRFEIIGVIDRHENRAQTVAVKRGYHHYAAAESLSDVPWLDEIEALIIATAPMSHYKLAQEALKLGKHVLTEKPFCMSVQEGEDLAAAAIAANRQLAIVHNFQFAHAMKKLRADIEQDRIGSITGIDAAQFGNPARRLPVWYEQLPLGLFYDESPHLLYLLRSLAGDMQLVRSSIVTSSKGHATPSRVEAWFKTDKKFPVKLSCNFESPVSEWYLMVFGEKQLGIVDIFRDIYLSLPNDRAHGTLQVLRTSLTATLQHWLQHVTRGIPHLLGGLSYGNDEVFERFARAIRGHHNALKPIDAESALTVLKLQHAIIDKHTNIYSA
jgi:predicted dehydrogenase